MRKLYTLLLLAAVLLTPAFGQDVAVKYANTITEADMKEKLTVLASDDFAGRETGTEGQRKASIFLENFYKDLGLIAPVNGTYRQKFNLYQSDWTEVYVRVGRKKLKNGEDIVFIGNADLPKETKMSLVYVGDASDEAIADMDLKGKAVITTTRDRKIMAKLKETGVRAVFSASEDEDQFAKTLPRMARGTLVSRLRFEENPKDAQESITFYITISQAADMLRSTKEKLIAAKTSAATIKARTTRLGIKKKLITVGTENMMAFLEGTDKKEEILVISSHYDHIGTNSNGEINNGADDDGSGTTGVMEIAEAFVQAAQEGHRPRRSILFLNVTGEEKGLMGSAYYSDHPIFPLENTVNDLNIDMIGRVDPDHEDDRDYIYVVGSAKLSSHLKIISEYANISYTNLNFDYKYDDPSDKSRIYYRSDHYNFAKHGIPIIFYFNGTHADYHRPSDTIDKIEWDVMAKRAQLVFHTAWILANREERTPVDSKDDMSYGN